MSRKGYRTGSRGCRIVCRTSRIPFRWSYRIGYRMSRIVERMSRMATGQSAEAAA
jgi:hypothetical protein